MATAAVELVNVIRFALDATAESYWPPSARGQRASSGIGEQLGHDVARIFAVSSIEELVSQLSSFWRSGGLGEVSIVQKNPLRIEVKNRYECFAWRIAASGTCRALRTSLIRTVFEDVLDLPVRVQEIECSPRQDKRGGPENGRSGRHKAPGSKGARRIPN